MIKVAPFKPVGNSGGARASRMMRVTFLFSFFPGDGTHDMVEDHDDTLVFRDERTGIIRPMSRMGVDGLGRRVAAEEAFTMPELSWLI